MEENIKRIKQAVSQVVSSEDDIVAVYLFGSLIEGYFTDRSDIDIGILFSCNVSVNREIEVALKIEKAVGREIDLLNLQSASLNLAFRVVSKGVLIYEGDPLKHSEFIEKLLKKYHDFRIDYKMFMEEFRKAING